MKLYTTSSFFFVTRRRGRNVYHLPWAPGGVALEHTFRILIKYDSLGGPCLLEVFLGMSSFKFFDSKGIRSSST